MEKSNIIAQGSGLRAQGSGLRAQGSGLRAQGSGLVLYLVIPCFNEEAVLPITAPLFLKKIKDLVACEKVSDDSRVLFVNDGSKDKTWDIISGLTSEDKHYAGISLSRNRGHQNALLAGLMESKNFCNITISMDCDGQHNIEAIDEMVDAYLTGYEIVYGIRKRRDTDTFFKRVSAEGFYKLLNWMGAEVISNHSDYRLLSHRILQELAKFQEVNVFLRGIIPLLGFKSAIVYYDCLDRVAGKSRYTLAKMLGLALDGITSLSIKPVRLIAIFGGLIAALSFLEFAWAVVMSLSGRTVSGWTSTMCVICLMGGIQLLSLGIIGEYVGKTYLETKHRPRYIVSEKTNL